MIDFTLSEPDTSLYYLAPQESDNPESTWKNATCNLWGNLSESARLVLEHAHRAKRRPFPWNEGGEDPSYLQCLERVSPDDVVNACAAQERKISLADWLRIHDLNLDPFGWPRYSRTSIAMIEAASRVLLPDTLVTFGTIAGIPAGCFAAGEHTPKRHVLVSDMESRCRPLSACLDGCGPPIEQLSSSDAKGAGIAANLVIGSFLAANLEWFARPAMAGDLITGGFLAANFDSKSGNLGQEMLRLMSASLPPPEQIGSPDIVTPAVLDYPYFLICPADPNVCAFEKTLENLRRENLSIAAMLTVREDSESWIVLQRGASDIIHSIMVETANDPTIEKFLRYVFGTSETAPLGLMTTPSNRFLSPQAMQAAEHFRKRAERTKMPLVQPGQPGNALLGADFLYGLWQSICFESEDRYREPNEIKRTRQHKSEPHSQELQRYFNGWFRSSLGSAYGRILDMSCVEELEGMWPAERLPALPLPEQEFRNRILDLQGRILTLEADAVTLRDEVWSKPLLIKEHENRFTRINIPEDSPGWIDDIPFPIANIVWQIHTSLRAKDKLDLLLKMFEGLASFHASILISMAVEQPSLCDDLRTVLPELKDNGCDIRRATFGTWVQIYERLARVYRSENSSQNRIPVAEWLGSSAREKSDLLGKLASKETSRILKSANNLRNRISGHGGVVTEEAAAKHVEDLQALLACWRKEVGAVWHELRLLQPTDQMRKSAGTFYLQARVLVGVRQPFPLETVSLTEAMDSDWLYLHQVGSSQTLRLLPFIRVSEPPVGTQAACYFYNRRESDGAHFVSYHYGDTPEKTFPSDPADILFAMLG